MRTGGIPTTLLFPSRFLASSTATTSSSLAVVLRSSRSIARGVLRTLPRPRGLHLRARGAPLPSRTFPASCATVNHSACDCVRLITVIRLLLVPVYRPLIIIIDFSRTSLPCFHAASYAADVRPNGFPVAPRRAAGHGKACHSAGLHP